MSLDECRRHDALLRLPGMADGKEKFLLLGWQLEEEGLVGKGTLVDDSVEGFLHCLLVCFLSRGELGSKSCSSFSEDTR